MTLSFFTYIPAAILFSICLYMILIYSPELFEEFKVKSIEFLQQNREMLVDQDGDQVFNARVQSIEDKTELRKTIESFFQKLVSGFFVSPVITIILRKKPI